MRSVTIDVIDGTDIKSEYLASVPDKVFQSFTKRSKATLNAYIAKWVREDWSTGLPMTHLKHCRKLRDTILRVSKQNYPELYVIDEVTIDDAFWIDLWFASHMLQEVQNDNSS